MKNERQCKYCGRWFYIRPDVYMGTKYCSKCREEIGMKVEEELIND